MRAVVASAFRKCASAAVDRGKRPSPTVLRLLGLYSGNDEVDFARAK
jgi:hypothetical protein